MGTWTPRPWSSTRSRQRLLELGVFAAVVVLIPLGASGVPLRIIDDTIYAALAASVADGRGLVLPASVPVQAWHTAPLYPFLLAPGYWLGGTVRAAALWGTWLNAVLVALGAVAWVRVLRRTLPPAAAALCVLWPLCSFDTLFLLSTQASDGPAFAVLALVALRTTATARRPAHPLARALELAIAATMLPLLRTQLVLVPIVVLWVTRRAFSRRTLLVASTSGVVVFALFKRVLSPNVALTVPYGRSIEVGWEGGWQSLGARTLKSNLLHDVWAAAADLLVSPYLYDRRIRAALGDNVSAWVGGGLALTCAMVYAWQVRRNGVRLPRLLPVVPAVVAPFLFYPYTIYPRYLVVVAPLVAWLPVWTLWTVTQARWRIARVVLPLTAAALVYSWVRQSPLCVRRDQARLEDTTRFLADARAACGGLQGMCATVPEAFWLADPSVRLCRSDGVEFETMPPGEGGRRRLERLVKTGEPRGTLESRWASVPLPSLPARMQLAAKSELHEAWCAPVDARP